MKKRLSKIKYILVIGFAALLLGACTPQQAIAMIFHDQQAKATAIAHCESRMNPNAVSPTNDHGLFQINATTWNKPGHSDPVADWIGRNWHKRYDPVTNTLMAHMIQQKYGWKMWSCN